MKSYKVQYKGTMYFTRNESLGDATLDDAANCEFKNATAYGKIMMLEGGKLMDAWEKAVAPTKLQSLPTIQSPEITEDDGYLIIKGKDVFADVVIDKESITVNGEVIWQASGNVKPEAEEIIEKTTVKEEAPVKEEEPAAVEEAPVVEEKAPVTEETPVKEDPAVEEVPAPTEEAPAAEETPAVEGNGKTVPIGMKLGKNGQNIQHTYGTFTLGIKIAGNPNPKRLNIPVGNDNWKRQGPVYAEQNPEVVEPPKPADPPVVLHKQHVPITETKSEQRIPEPQQYGTPRRPVFTKGNTTPQPVVEELPVEQPQHFDDRSNALSSAWAPGAEEANRNALYQQSQPVQLDFGNRRALSHEETSALMSVTSSLYANPQMQEEQDKFEQMRQEQDVWKEALNAHTILRGEEDATTALGISHAENSLGDAPIEPVVEEAVDLPDWFEMIPKVLLKNLSSFTTRNVDNNVIDNDYVLVERWDKMGSWYATDVVDSAERIFFNSQNGNIYRARFGQCKQYLQKVGDI